MWHRRLVVALLLVAWATLASCWTLTFSEEFDGPLNPAIWNVADNRTHCSPCEAELYVSSAVTVESGHLVIRTDRQKVVGPNGQVFAYTSGWIDTEAKWYQTFGRFEVRASLPQARGAWPAHWLMPNPATAQPPGVCWPVGGEIDIMEYAGGAPGGQRIAGSYRWGTACGDDEQPLPGALYPPVGAPPVNYSDFHVFAVEWNSTAITFLVDDTAYETVASPDVPIPDYPFYWILNTAIAWFYPPLPTTHFPTYHIIDYVRVYS